ncbi:Manganese transport system membrane protein MntB [Phycisphaerae bacterium RAS1]|nr:Manganese transport system membrane protein MntB [Phycisphaerae bacterium RAS1]
MNPSITDNTIRWPSAAEWLNVLTLADYNTRVVVIGVTLLGMACGLVGSFMLLRKRALLGDALSHATLPGIAAAFLIASALGLSGKSLAVLLTGATISGSLGVLCVLAVVHLTRIKEDAAMGIVLSVFFGLGVTLTGVIQSMGTGHAAGLKSFIYGKTASMLWGDALLIGATAAAAAAVLLAFYKEFKLLCFDADFAAALGRPVLALDVLLMTLVVAVTVIGLQAVGLILIIALLIIPPAAARFWTDHLPTMLIASVCIAAASCALGAMLSAVVPRLPSGAVIVAVAGLAFSLSMLAGPARGVLPRLIDQRRLSRKIARQHLLRALYELSEPAGAARETAVGIEFRLLMGARSWSAAGLRRELRRAFRDGLVLPDSASQTFRLTQPGFQAAWRVARNHRLWELFLISHADIAPSHVDRDADQVEHVLDAEMIRLLELQLAAAYPDLQAPHSPHAIRPRKPE